MTPQQLLDVLHAEFLDPALSPEDRELIITEADCVAGDDPDLLEAVRTGFAQPWGLIHITPGGRRDDLLYLHQDDARQAADWMVATCGGRATVYATAAQGYRPRVCLRCCDQGFASFGCPDCGR